MVEQIPSTQVPSDGVPMVKVGPSGFDMLSGITVAQATMLLGLSENRPESIRDLMISMGMVGSLFTTGAIILQPYCIWPQGQDLDVNKYSLLYGVYGTRFGSSGANLFSAPDLRNHTVFGYDGVATIGSSIGLTTHALGGVPMGMYLPFMIFAGQ